MRFINVSVLHTDIFEATVKAEIVRAAGMTEGSKGIQIVSTKGGLEGMATLVRFEIHPGDPAVTVDEAISTLLEQASDPDSDLRTKGSFLRRIIDREGSLNIVKIRVDPGKSDQSGGNIVSSATEIDVVNPFIDLTIDTITPAPAATDGRVPHAGIAGIAVASSFLGLALIVSSVWYAMHRTEVGVKYKQARRESKGTSMKIQLTEAEKAEMGLHANPSNADSKSSTKVKEAVQMIKAAVAQDEAKNYQGALNLYQGAVDRFMIAMKFERNATYKFELAKKCDRYLVRIKQLKEYTSNHPDSGNAGSAGSVHAASVARRSPSMVRAPLMK